jgi:SAM-dependent methyltransferase
MDESLLHEMNPTGRFSDRASDYARYRPTYPPAAIDFILGGFANPSHLVAADVGAGTGISARLLADRGVRVFAVEPNAAMREAASTHDLVQWRDGTAEATGLPGESVDLVLCAQAFHWFRQREAVAEFHRILRAGGRMALMWNNRDRGDDMTRSYIEAIHSVNGEHPAEQREIEPGVIEAEARFMPPRLETFEHWQDLDCAGLIGRATSASYVPSSGEEFEVLRNRLIALYDKYRDARDLVRLMYVTKVYLAARR